MLKNDFFFSTINSYIKKYYILIIGGYAVMTLSSGLNLILPLLIGNLIDDLTLISWNDGRIILGIVVTSFFLQAISTYILEVSGNKITRDMRKRFWRQSLYGKINDFDKTKSGEISSSLMHDTSSIASFISFQLPNMIVGLIRLIGSASIMFYLDYVLTIIMIVLLPCLLISIFIISDKVHILSEKKQCLLGKGNSYFTECIARIRLVKSYGAEKEEIEKGSKEIEKAYIFEKKNAKILAFLTPILGGAITLMLLSIIGIGLYRIRMDYISLGAFVSFLLYFYEAMEPVQIISSFIVEFKEITGKTKRFFILLNRDTEMVNKRKSIEITGAISFRNVHFEYQKNLPILKDVSFIAETGKQTVIVGESGSGKTTIISLLQRFYRPNKGIITIGNQPINNLPLYEWRSVFGYVPQEATIISGTVRENILYGIKKSITEEELIKVALQAEIYHDIMKLPKKFNTYVGEAGVYLSGGQKQRIAIARAMIRNPKYLLLDEATANLDAHSEKNIQNAIRTLMKGRTSIIIAHRLSTIIDADQVIVLQNGKITGEGKHEELIRSHLYYKELVQKQLLLDKEDKPWTKAE